MTSDDLYKQWRGGHWDVLEYIKHIDSLNKDFKPTISRQDRHGKYDIDWVDSENMKHNGEARAVRGVIMNKKEARCDYTSEWVDWLNGSSQSLWSKDSTGKKITKISFKENNGLIVKTIEDGDSFTLSPDFSDRGDRASVKFCLCLEAFAEKTYNRKGKLAFFENSVGEKWSSYETMKSLEPWVKMARDTVEIRGEISLNDSSVRKYPVNTFEIFEEVFFNELKLKEPKEEPKVEPKEEPKTFKFSVAAQEFVPGAELPWGTKEEKIPLLTRCGPPKRWACYLVEQGKPPSKTRPRTSSKNSTQHVTWQVKDNAFQELNEKMDKIIHGLETPVIQAHEVV